MKHGSLLDKLSQILIDPILVQQVINSILDPLLQSVKNRSKVLIPSIGQTPILQIVLALLGYKNIINAELQIHAHNLSHQLGPFIIINADQKLNHILLILGLLILLLLLLLYRGDSCVENHCHFFSVFFPGELNLGIFYRGMDLPIILRKKSLVNLLVSGF